VNNLPECKYRRYSRRRDGTAQLHCFLRRGNCTASECIACDLAAKEAGKLMELSGPDGAERGRYYETTDPNLVKFGHAKPWTVKHPSRGLGDTIAKVTHVTGIAGVVHKVTKALGYDCGCTRRQDILNKLVPYKTNKKG